MDYRSTNTTGYSHHGGALVVGKELGSGIEFNPTSSGAAPTIIAAGDESNKSLIIGGKGSGGIQVGQNSTTPITNLARFVVQFTPPALAASVATESTYTVTGLTTNCSILGLTARTAYSTQYIVHSPRCSTANELVVVWSNKNASTIGTGESTNRWTLTAAIF